VKGTHNPNQLVVEGQDDLFAVVGLMRAHADWPEGPASETKAPVFIHNGNGASEILNRSFISVFLKSPVLKAGGIVLDADASPQGRYASLRQLCDELFPTLPAEIPSEGLIVENDEHRRLGIWIMPDNSSEGTLETFLKWLVPAPRDPAWTYAEESVQKARGFGCGCRECHIEKANLYTWLSWQDPPGQSPGVALTKRILDPQSPSAAPFVAWFMKLYQLPPRNSLFP
jgi:hypothetical protein